MSAIESQVIFGANSWVLDAFWVRFRLDVCVSIEVGASTSFLLGLGLEHDTGRSWGWHTLNGRC